MPPNCIHAPSAAKLFVQLSTGARLQNSILEVFLPLQTQRARTYRTATPSRPATRPRIQYFAAPNFRVGRHDGVALLAPSRRAFSSTTARRKTLAIHNPQVDENGEEMVVELTPRAANVCNSDTLLSLVFLICSVCFCPVGSISSHTNQDSDPQRLTKIMTKDANPNLALCIQVEAGGCHGFQYLMKLVTLPESTSASPNSNTDSSSNPPPSAEVEATLAPSTTTSTKPAVVELKEDDTIFAFVKDDTPPEQVADKKALAAGPKIVLDTMSLDLLKGSKLDFTMELIGSQFKIIDNPAATSSCGCGTSFEIKL
jgi:iron-sulfur cluster assembly 2